MNSKIHKSLSAYYSKFLNMMDEPILHQLESEEEVYRFLWLRSSKEPISLRLNINNDIGIVTIKSIKGASGYPNSLGKVSKHAIIKISKHNVDEFLRLANKEFWSKSPTIEDFYCLDGAIWIVEGVRNSKYHIQVVHCPKSNDNTKHLGNYLLKMTGL